MKQQRLLILAAGLLLLPLAWRAIYLAQQPAFAVGHPQARRPGFEFRDVEFSYQTPRGEIRIQASSTREGHETVGFFRLGPSTYLELVGVRASCTTGADQSHQAWCVRGSTARLCARKLEFRDGARASLVGAPDRRCGEIVIDIESGSMTMR